MRILRLAAVLAVLGIFCCGTAIAQELPQLGLYQPEPAKRTSFGEFGSYYSQGDVPSPSDEPRPPGGPPSAPGDYANNSCCDDGCNDCCGCGCYLFGPDEAMKLFCESDCTGITAGGWISFGYHDEQTPLSAAHGDGLAFNDVPGRLNNHQSWLYIEKVADTERCCWDWGFRADILYGTDAQKTQAFGGTGWDNDWDHGVYGWAIPQAYVEVARGDLSVKVGHFYTLVGYEVVQATGNFFYSHSLTMFNTEPFTHTGVLASYASSDCLTVHAGWTAGWDTGFENFNDGSSFLGGFSYQICDDISFTYIVTAGNFGARGDNAYSHSLLLDVTLTEKLNYVLQSDVLRVTNIDGQKEDDVGINQYLIYWHNDCVGVAARLEWWKDEGVSHYEATYGVNVRPHANLTIRPEVRHDWQPGNAFDVTTFGIDAILTF